MLLLKQLIYRKVEHYTQIGNSEKLRKYLREKWAVIGMYDHNLEFQPVLHVLSRFVRLDLVPAHYNYPEFYIF